MILSLYVDDVLLASNDLGMLNDTKDWLKSQFEMKDMGDASFVLGIKIIRDRNVKKLSLSQEAYLDKILKRFKMELSKPVDMPIHKGIKLSKTMALTNEDDEKEMANKSYAQAVGSLMYAMLCTRPDISYAVSLVS